MSANVLNLHTRHHIYLNRSLKIIQSSHSSISYHTQFINTYPYYYYHKTYHIIFYAIIIVTLAKLSFQSLDIIALKKQRQTNVSNKIR